jgi:predicted DNA binding CopG/RHH family protein
LKKSEKSQSEKSIAAKVYESTDLMDQDLETSDLSNAFHVRGRVRSPKIKKINLDLPEWLVAELDKEAARAGVSRQPLIKIWLIQKLEEERRKRTA